MFLFFKSTLEKNLIKLGLANSVNQYKQKLKNKELTKKEYNNALQSLFNAHQTQLKNIKNVNVATRQTFDDDALLVPLNLQNIKQEFIDYDFIYSSLLFEYNNNKRIHTKALHELNKLLTEQYPDAVCSDTDLETVKKLTIEELINQATVSFTNENKNYLKAVFTQLFKYA